MHVNLSRRSGSGVVVGYAAYGDPAGTPLIFCHGWPGSHHQAQMIDAPARKRGLRVLAPNRPGIGQSSPMSGIDVRQWANVMGGFADAMGIDRFYLLGVSGGGPYALASAAVLPERLVAVGVCCGAPPIDLIPDRRGLHWFYRTLLAVDWSAPRLSKPLMTGIRSLVTGFSAEHTMRPLVSLMPAPDRRTLSRRENLRPIAESVDAAFENGIEPVIQDARRIKDPWGFDLEAVVKPVHIWHGGRDRNIPVSTARFVAEKIRRPIMHIYPDDGHYSLPIRRCGSILDDLLGIDESRRDV